MSAVFNAIRAAQNAIACPVLAANNFVLGSVGSFVPGLNQPALAAINALRKLYGCNEAEDVEANPPFEGGQCDLNIYRFRVLETRSDGPTSVSPLIDARGPVNVRALVSGTDVDGNPTGYTLEIFSRGFAFVGAPFPGVLAPAWRFFGSRTVGGGVTLSVTFQDLVNQTNPADDCGNPPVSFPPPTVFNRDVNITYNTEEGDEVNVTIPFIFAPIQVDFNGNFRLPFTFDFGGNTFTGNFSLDPEFNLTINPPALPPGSDQGTEDLPPGDPEDEVEPLPIDEKIIGVVVTSSIIGEQQFTTILTQGMPNILAPRAGSIKFAYSLGATTFWSNDIDVKGDRIFIPCPFSQGADAVVVSPAPGVALQWVPISGPPLATKADVA